MRIDIAWPGDEYDLLPFAQFRRRGWKAAKVPVRIDGRPVTELMLRETLSLDLPSGARTLRVGWWFAKSQDVTVEDLAPGQRLVFRHEFGARRRSWRDRLGDIGIGAAACLPAFLFFLLPPERLWESPIVYAVIVPMLAAVGYRMTMPGQGASLTLTPLVP